MDVLFIIFMVSIATGYFLIQKRIDNLERSQDITYAQFINLEAIVRSNKDESHDNRQLLWKEVNKLEKEIIER